MSNPITELFSLPIEKNEIGFIYFGFSGVIFRTKDNTIAIDMCKLCLDSEDQIKALKTLDLQLNTHGHRDHFDLETTTNIFKVSGAKVIADTEVAKELKKEIPVDKFKAFILERDLTLQQVAIFLKISHSAVAKILNGRTSNPHNRTIYKIKKLIGEQ